MFLCLLTLTLTPQPFICLLTLQWLRGSHSTQESNFHLEQLILTFSKICFSTFSTFPLVLINTMDTNVLKKHPIIFKSFDKIIIFYK